MPFGRAISTVRSDASDADDPREGALLAANGRFSAAEQLYRQVARQTLQSRVEHFALKLGVQPASLRINGAKGRWGSCSGKNRLNFSWRLMLAPEHCIDYVVVHELCHILHHDHSAAFWQEVERVVPDWRSCRQQLVQTARAPWF